jgi:hypothetical protein
VDDIAALHLSAPGWIDRRVDRFEFAGLTTIHHSITLTLDLDELSARAAPGGRIVLPIGMFDRQRAPARVLDAEGAAVRHLPIRASNALFREALRARLAAVGVTSGVAGALAEIECHRADRCDLLRGSEQRLDGYAGLAAEKWGCPTVGALIARLGPAATAAQAHREVARLLFDWQNCDPLIVELACDEPRFGTLTVWFNEELTPWTPPWDRRHAALERQDRRGDPLLSDPELRRRTSRGGPFDVDLQHLKLRGARGVLSRSRWPRARKLGRRGLLPLSWHVVWEQWAVAGVERHIEIAVPPELAVLRLRSLRPAVHGERPPAAEVAHQVGLSAHLTLMPDAREAPELMSLLLGHRDRQSWIPGALVALLTAIGLLAAVWAALPRTEAQLEAAITVLLLGPAFTAGLLSARATSEIADELLIGLRWLLGLVAVTTVLAAGALVATEDRLTQVLVSLCAAALVVCGALLALGARRADRLRVQARERERPADVERLSTRLIAPRNRQRTPIPQRFIVSGEGERVPWGWLANASTAASSLDLDAREEDRRYWRAALSGAAAAAQVEPIVARGRELTGQP